MMEHRSLSEIRNKANVIAVAPPSREALRLQRRRRLELFATILDHYSGPVQPLSRIEYVSASERLLLRADDSPLSIAYRDATLREQGLGSDRVGDAVAFFSLTQGEAHHLFCECHYVDGMTSQNVAARARSIARRMSFGEICSKILTVMNLR
jgi:hypothetical protein